MARRLLLPLPLLLLAAVKPVLPQLPADHSTAWPYADDETDEPLGEVFTASFRAAPSRASGLWRYGRPPAVHDSLVARSGEILVQAMDNPKDPVGPWREDVLTVVAAPGHPASLTYRMPMEAKHHGMNRLQAFVYLSAESCAVDGGLINRTKANFTLTNATWSHTCASEHCCPRQPPYDHPDGVMTAWLAKHGDPSAVLREVSLSPVDYLGEWEEIGADFYVMPDEDGTGDDGAALYIRLGNAAAMAGSASLTGLRLTPVPQVNVAWLKPVGGAPPPPDDGVAAGDVLTNGIFAADLGETWYQIVGMNEEVSFSIELFGTFMVCSTVVQFSPGTQTFEWEFYMSHSNQGGVWTSVLLDDQSADLAAHGTLGWVPSSAPRYFPCQLAKRAKLTLRKTQNFIYSMTEWAMYGYDMGTDAPCEKECRHGGTCRYFGEPCRCVPKWGWRGPVCADDIDECELDHTTTLAQELSIEHANAGCGLGDRTASKCTNTDGGWTCTCYHGFAGPTTSIAPNECLDVNECIEGGPALVPGGPALPKGGCEQICINMIGRLGYGIKTTHKCECQQGFELQVDNRTCGPRCSQPCEHGSSCVEPEKCRECDYGWQGDYCEYPLCSNEVQVLNEATGELETMFGCYHGGLCAEVGECSECLGGWSGTDCGYFGAAATLALVIAILGLLLLLLPTLVFVGMRKTWLPFQERGYGLMMHGTFGCMVWVLTSCACGNPKFFGIRLVADAVQPESRLWGVWIPYTLGFTWYISCCLIRMRNLVLIHLKGETPFTMVCQLPLSVGLFSVFSLLPQPTALHAAWSLALLLLLVYFLMISIQCLPLRRDIDDIMPNMCCGLVSIGSMLGMFVCRLSGADYDNPNGLVGGLFPILFALVGLTHIGVTHARLAWSLRKAPKKEMIAKYSKGDDSYSDEDDEEEPKFGAKWKRKLLSKTKAVVAVGDTPGNASSDDEEGGGGGKGENSGKDGDGQSDGSGSASGSEYESSSESDSGSETAKQPEKQAKKEETQTKTDSPDGASSSPEAGGRGSGRGAPSRGRGRGRGWNRSSRGRATGRARGRIRLPALSLKASPAAAVAQAQPRTTAQLWSAVQRKAAEEADSDDSSEDSELEELAAEVKKFEKMVEKRKTRGKDGNEVPQFHGKTWGEQGVSGGGSSLDGFGLDMQMQARIMQKQADIWGPDSPTAAQNRPFSAPPKKTQQQQQIGSGSIGRPATAGVSRGASLLPGQAGSPTQPSSQQQAWSSGPSKDSDHDGHQADRSPTGAGSADSSAEAELIAWLESCRASEWLSGLQSLGVEKLTDMIDVEDEDLEELGMKPVPRRRLLRAIGQIQAVDQTQTGASAATAAALARPQSAPAWKQPGAGAKLSAISAIRGQSSQSGGAAQRRPASAAPVRSGWGGSGAGAGSELQVLQAQARELEEADTSSSEESDGDEDGPGRGGGGGGGGHEFVDDGVEEESQLRPRMETDAFPGDTRAARKGAKARAALAAARAFEAEITTTEEEEAYSESSEYDDFS
jgi:hypothetical protein